MAQLLKAAQLLTNNKNLNPTGSTYLEEFSSVPSIESNLMFRFSIIISLNKASYKSHFII